MQPAAGRGINRATYRVASSSGFHSRPADAGRLCRIQRLTVPALRRPQAWGHIVVAYQDPALLDLMVRTLRNAGHCVFQAHDGLAAFELALALRAIDLLITNTHLPGLNGPELIRQVRAQVPALPILYVHNGDARPIDLPTGISTLREPFTADELLAAVGPLIARQAGTAPAATPPPRPDLLP